jgi:hypothetical protein
VRLASGELRPVPCGRRNSCPYCAWKAVAQNMAVVARDARDRQPTHGITLTTRDPRFSPERYRKACSQWFRWLRSEVGDVEYLALMEWTVRSRLMHQHTLVKGLPSGSCDPLWRAGKRRWEKLTGAYRVELRELRTPAGAIAYMVAHHHKREQAPPAGWSGKRFRPSRHYFERPIAQLRAEVKADHAERARVERLVREAAEHDLDEHELQELLELPVAKAEVVKLRRTPRGRVCTEDGQVVPRSLVEAMSGPVNTRPEAL